MSKYDLKELWEYFYGRKVEVKDYSGRIMYKSALSDPKNPYQPTIEHIRPLSKGGSDVLENIVICRRDTNEEKADKFPAWIANKKRWHAVRKKGSRIAYTIEKDES